MGNTAETLFQALFPKEQHQLELEKLYDKNQLTKRVRQAFIDYDRVDFSALIKNAELPEEFGLDLLTQMAIHRRATVPTLIGCLRHHCTSDQEVACLLERAVIHNLLEYSSRDQQLIVIYGIGEKLQKELDRFQYPLPMVVEPKLSETNLDTGYLTSKGSVILRDNYHTDDVCLDHLNRINQTKFSVNLDVAQTIQNKWKGLDKKHPDESWDDFKKRRKAFEKYCQVAKDVINLLLKMGNELYLTHRYDKRGRTYCMGHHVTYQGTDWNKAVLEFAEQEKLTET
jgi:hypothetical protein